jgi:hypothetical protein
MTSHTCLTRKTVPGPSRAIQTQIMALSIGRSKLICLASKSATHGGPTRTYERVLRYPDGNVRRMVYPVVEEVEEVMEEPAPCPYGFWQPAPMPQEPRIELPSTSYSPSPAEEKSEVRTRRRVFWCRDHDRYAICPALLYAAGFVSF